MKFSKLEIRELITAWLAVSLMFAIAEHGFHFLLGSIPLALLSVGTAFILHELAHKYVAQHFGCAAEFRSSHQALIIGLFLSLGGYVFAAPGAVHVFGANREQHGKIALAGPLTNVFLAFFFLTLFYFHIFPTLSRSALMINSLLGIFNLLPIPPFDGHAVWNWNKKIYSFAIILAGIAAMVGV